MTQSRLLIVLYAVIALLALAGTWAHNAAYLHLGYVAANLQFWNDTLISEASASITTDIFFLALALNLWMVLEARRLGMRWVWAYIVAGILVAISVAFPLFMIHRERALASTSRAPGGTLRTGDIIGLVVLAAGVLAFCARTFMH